MCLVSIGAHLEEYGDAGVNHCFLVAIYNIYILLGMFIGLRNATFLYFCFCS